MLNKKRIFVCSRFRSDSDTVFREQLEQTKKLARTLTKQNYGYVFIPHLMYPQFLKEEQISERNLGIESGLSFLDICDEMFVLHDRERGISDGMKKEIQYAVDHGIYLTVLEYVSKNKYRKVNHLLNEWKEDWLKTSVK